MVIVEGLLSDPASSCEYAAGSLTVLAVLCVLWKMEGEPGLAVAPPPPKAPGTVPEEAVFAEAPLYDEETGAPMNKVLLASTLP